MYLISVKLNKQQFVVSRLSPMQGQSETVEEIEVMENDEIRDIRRIRDTKNDKVCNVVKPPTGGNADPCSVRFVL